MQRFLTFFWLSVAVSFATIGCQNETQSQEKQQATTEEKPLAPLALEDDYSSVLLELSKKEYEPLAKRILVNHDVVKAKLPELQTGRMARSIGEDLVKRQHQIENAFSDAMKNFDYLEEKLASKEMTKAQYLQERQNVLNSLKSLDGLSASVEKVMAGNYIDSLIGREKTMGEPATR